MKDNFITKINKSGKICRHYGHMDKFHTNSFVYVYTLGAEKRWISDIIPPNPLHASPSITPIPPPGGPFILFNYWLKFERPINQASKCTTNCISRQSTAGNSVSIIYRKHVGVYTQ